VDTDAVLNRERLRGNTCFGCGHDNPESLGLEIRRDPDDPERLLGRFRSAEHLVGFPGITHGGVLYSVMDCLAAWTPTVLRPATRAIWILRTATLTYRRPLRVGVEVRLAARIREEGGPWEAVVVEAEARDPERQLLADGGFKVVPLPPERFCEVAGIERLPDNWRELLGEAGD